MSGIGKGVIAASIGKILQVRGLKVTAAKVDPDLNYDAGTMNPYIHGEVFVTEDGGETDMDIGTYERFLDINVPKSHNITTGQIYSSVIERERRGDFLGKCVQIIPHITDEIKDRLRNIASEGVDLVIVEIGGTVGDIESLPYLEAARQFRLDEGISNVVNVHVTLVPMLDVVGEQKTKPTQHSVQELRRIGVQPDVIVARSKVPLRPEPRKKIALFCNVEESAVFTSQDIASIYESPLLLDEQGLGNYLVTRLQLSSNSPDWSSWKKMIKSHLSPRSQVTIAICGKYAELADCYVSVNDALRDAGAALDAKVNLEFIETDDFEKGGTMRLGAHEILIDEGTLAYSLYQRTKVWERHRHRYEVNPEYIAQLTSGGLRFSGKSDSNRRMEILELPKERFHFATQFHAEFKSRPGRPSPPYLGFVRAATSKRPTLESEQIVASSRVSQ